MISTSVIIFLGFSMIVPVFFLPSPPRQQNQQLRIMVSISILNASNVSNWCNELASFLKTQGIEATVFFTGDIAVQYPRCVAEMPLGTDIGSQTYNYVNLTSIPDYLQQLHEVQLGKEAVDAAGNLNSSMFKAPFGSTDQNIYSLLSISGILADFSYPTQYNMFQKGQFIRYSLTSYNGTEHMASFFLSLPKTADPIMIMFDSTAYLPQLEQLLSELKTGGAILVNASTVTGLDLTQRR